MLTRFSVARRLLLGLLCSVALFGCGQNEDPYQVGTHYTDMGTATPGFGKADVIEFFSYGCRHCREFSPKLSAWNDDRSRLVRYVPVLWNDIARLHAMAYYLIEPRPDFPILHEGLFTLIGGFSRLDTLKEQEEKLSAWLAEHGIPSDQSYAAFHSDALAARLLQADKLARRFEISATPTLVIHQRYRIENASLKSHEDLLEIADWLLEHRD